MQKWEYKTMTSHIIPVESGFNKYGEEGWELITVVRNEDGKFEFIFKRPKS